jgi:hypothetical protein
MTSRTCFVIAPIGISDHGIRERSDHMLARIIRPAAEPFGYRVVRSDEFAAPGLIDLQIAAQLIEADLVIADLTGWNFNVGYELGGRHAIGKPTIQMISVEERVPADVSMMRTIFVDMASADGVEAAVNELQTEIRAVQPFILTPVSVLVDVQTTVRDEKTFSAAAGGNCPRPASPQPRKKGQRYLCGEHPLFWQSLNDLPDDSVVEESLSVVLRRVLENPYQAPATADGVHMMTTAEAPALRLTYLIDRDVVQLLHVCHLGTVTPGAR